MNHEVTYRIFSLGDTAVTVDFGNHIDENSNRRVISLFHYLTDHPLPGMKEAVPAYSSLTVYYDVMQVKRAGSAVPAHAFVRNRLEEIIKQATAVSEVPPRLVEVPVCYDGADLAYIAKEKNRTVDEVIQLHCSRLYKVYMLGFLPGFPYMGETDERIFIPRQKQPRSKVEAGSVAIAGNQTGIYPLASPGGWQIIGRTPLKIFKTHCSPAERDEGDFKEAVCLFQPGDRVKFYPVSKYEFDNY